VLRCRNLRSGREDGVLFWGAENSGEPGIGCFNPTEYSQAGDWQVGDEIVLLDMEPEASGMLAGLVSANEAGFPGSYALADGCGTGWNLNAEHMRFGRSGIVGSWWKELYVEIKFSQPVAIGGIKTDSSEELPYKVECLTKAGVWEVVKENCRGTTRLDSTVMTRAVKLSWMDTDMHKLGGLCTMRSGGGIHAEVWLEV